MQLTNKFKKLVSSKSKSCCNNKEEQIVVKCISCQEYIYKHRLNTISISANKDDSHFMCSRCFETNLYVRCHTPKSLYFALTKCSIIINMNLPKDVLLIISEFGFGEKRQCTLCYREEDEIDDCFDNSMCQKCVNPMIKCPDCFEMIPRKHITYCLLCRKQACLQCIDICCDIYSTSDTDY